MIWKIGGHVEENEIKNGGPGRQSARELWVTNNGSTDLTSRRA